MPAANIGQCKRRWQYIRCHGIAHPHVHMAAAFKARLTPPCPMRQLRSAWAIAQTLGRALVFPKMWAGLDRWWAPHDGIIPGSNLVLPYIAPFDHVMDLEGCASVPRVFSSASHLCFGACSHAAA